MCSDGRECVVMEGVCSDGWEECVVMDGRECVVMDGRECVVMEGVCSDGRECVVMEGSV